MSTDYYAVSDRCSRAVAITDNKGNPINRQCWSRFLVECILPFEDPEIRLVAQWGVPEGYVECGNEWGSDVCEGGCNEPKYDLNAIVKCTCDRTGGKSKFGWVRQRASWVCSGCGDGA